jgi:hypothetical protein
VSNLTTKPYIKNNKQKRARRLAEVVQHKSSSVSPEFKPQYCQENPQKAKKTRGFPSTE